MACSAHLLLPEVLHRQAHTPEHLGHEYILSAALDDCKNTDKFSVSRLESCANVCYSEKECEYYVYGVEDGMSKCWLRRPVLTHDGRS